ncbi:MAG: S41 family peptidase [Flavobacteriales bacterium]|nr:S41 family peptidase [Flavobacteriales bacterium]MCX7768212.1 S41 family peptidase [Flavobacteriales bacterium]MDW8409163.1 S41 family peptidase [Flavobacteriales bacterium]
MHLLRIASFFILTVLWYPQGRLQNPGDSWQVSDEKLRRFFQHLRNNYVDAVNPQKMAEEAIRGVLRSLDPHSYYMTRQEAQDANDQLQGHFEGIGISYYMDRDTLYILGTIEDSPADRSGLCPGDRLIKVSDTLVAGVRKTSKDITRLIRQAPGGQVRLVVIRPEEPAPLHFTVKKDRIPYKAVTAAYLIDNQTGYIRLARFSSQAHRELVQALKKLNREGMNRLILDLRDNSGGYLTAAVEVAGEFLPPQSLVVYTEGLHSHRKNYEVKQKGHFTEGEIIVLVDQNSASASEIVAGAIQDLDRGIIVGRRSFGKGLVQNTYYFPDGSAIRLTTARYYTPSGRCIQRPYIPGRPDDYHAELRQREKRGELRYKDSIPRIDSLRFYTRNKRPVYGGGGIIPDVFVPRDSLLDDTLLRALQKNNYLYTFALHWVDKNRRKINQQYSGFQDFEKRFTPGPDLVEALQKFYQERGITLNLAEASPTPISRAYTLLKAQIARVIWDTEEYLRIQNTVDADVQTALRCFGPEALSILKSPDDQSR